MESYKQEFIEFMVESDVLKFGEFTLKSGRKSPFFMNAGAYVTGSQLKKLGQYYAKAIHDTYGDDFDVLFGPAYKGIPLGVVTAIAYSDLYGKEVRYCSDRKEEKDHGADKGSFLGSKLKDGDRVIMIEDVTTSGKSMEETVPKVKGAADVTIVGLMVSLNRMEVGKGGEKCALDEIKDLYGFDTAAIVTGQSHLLPFLGAAALFAALTIMAHSLVLGLAAVIAGPVPAAQTALSLSRKAVSGAAQEEAASVAEAAPESTGTAASLPEAAAPTGGIESYLVKLLGDDARPEGAGAVIEKNYPQGSGEKYVACGTGSIKNNTRQTAADIAAEIQAPLPFGVEKDSPDPQILIMHTHATEDYRLSAGLWYSPGDGARTTDTNLNMCAVGRVMADTLNAAGLNTLHDETLNDYPSYTGSYENSRAVVQRYLSQYPSIKVVLDVHRDAIETEGGSRMAPVCTVDGRQAAQVMIICGCDNGGSVRLPSWRQNLRFAAAWERSMEGMYPGFTRPVLFSYRFYNQDLTTGSLLIEIGGHGNNLNEALYAGQLAANGLVQALLSPDT